MVIVYFVSSRLFLKGRLEGCDEVVFEPLHFKRVYYVVYGVASLFPFINFLLLFITPGIGLGAFVIFFFNIEDEDKLERRARDAGRHSWMSKEEQFRWCVISRFHDDIQKLIKNLNKDL